MQRWSSRPGGGGRLARSPWSLWGWGAYLSVFVPGGAPSSLPRSSSPAGPGGTEVSLEVGVSRAVVPLAERPRSADSPARASSGCLTSVRAPSGVRGAEGVLAKLLSPPNFPSAFPVVSTPADALRRASQPKRVSREPQGQVMTSCR